MPSSSLNFIKSDLSPSIETRIFNTIKMSTILRLLLSKEGYQENHCVHTLSLK